MCVISIVRQCDELHGLCLDAVGSCYIYAYNYDYMPNRHKLSSAKCLDQDWHAWHIRFAYIYVYKSNPHKLTS
jgi:hypothetical protein